MRLIIFRIGSTRVTFERGEIVHFQIWIGEVGINKRDLGVQTPLDLLEKWPWDPPHGARESRFIYPLMGGSIPFPFLLFACVTFSCCLPLLLPKTFCRSLRSCTGSRHVTGFPIRRYRFFLELYAFLSTQLPLSVFALVRSYLLSFLKKLESNKVLKERAFWKRSFNRFSYS